MPNWNTSTYVCEGNPADIRALHNLMIELQSRQARLYPNGFSITWLRNLLIALGGDWEKVYCRGSWNDPEIYPDGTLHFNLETAWGSCRNFATSSRLNTPA